MFGLPKALIADLAAVKDAAEALMSQLNDLSADVNTALDDNRGEFEERSERWQEGERGEITSEWLDTLDEFAATVDTALDDLSNVVDGIDNLEEKPNY